MAEAASPLRRRDGVPVISPRSMSPDFQTFTSPLLSHTTPSGVSMLRQKPSVRVSPRLRGSLFYSEWEIIERDDVKKRERRNNRTMSLVEVCSRWNCKERKKGKNVTGTIG